jgi:hypothetical protein
MFFLKDLPVKIQLHDISASESGDYYQVLFEGALDGEQAYVLVQRQFELPDGGLCYVESHDKNYIGHFKVTYAELGRNRFFLKLARKTAAEVEVVFNTTEKNWRQVVRIMQFMIPRLRVSDSSTRVNVGTAR